MHEQDPHNEDPDVIKAAQHHWQALANPAGLQEEFVGNYLGCWPDRETFGTALALDCGLHEDTGPGLARQLGASQELAYVPDAYGVHVFVHPIGQDTRRPRAAERLRHLQLVPRLLEEDEVIILERSTTRPSRG